MRVLLSPGDVAALRAEPFQYAPVGVTMGPLEFPRMYALHPKPTLQATAGGELPATVELVDDRYFWDGRTPSQTFIDGPSSGPNDDFNKTGQPDKSGEFGRSGREILEIAFFDLGIPITNYQILVDEDAGEELDKTDPFVDILAVGQEWSRIIESVCIRAGLFLAWTPFSGVEYTVRPIRDGDEMAEAALANTNGTSYPNRSYIISGGVWGATANTGGNVFTKSDLGSHAPEFVRVHFPQSPPILAEGGQGAGSFSTNPRHYIVESSNGRPTEFEEFNDGTGETVYDATWARYVQSEPGGSFEVENAAELQERADAVASIYYDRFRSGACAMRFGKLLPLEQWPADFEWRIIHSGKDAGVYTACQGRFDDPRLGWDACEPITPQDIIGNSDTRVMIRPEGGVLVESISEGGDQVVLPCRIVQSVGDPPTYVVTLLRPFGGLPAPGEPIGPLENQQRVFDPATPGVSYIPAEPNTVGLLAWFLSEAAPYRLWVREYVETASCPSASQSASSGHASSFLNLIRRRNWFGV